LTLVPVSTATNAPGTAITLPFLPNSIVIDPPGNNVYLGSSSGLMIVNILNSTVTTQSVTGTIVAISPDSGFLLLSDSANNAVYYYNLSTQMVGSTVSGLTTSGAYTPDAKSSRWLSGNQVAVGSQIQFSSFVPLPNTGNALGISAQGGLTYITGSNPNQFDIFSTCNNSQTQTLSANSPTLIQAIPNGTGAVATDSPAMDLVSTPGTLSPGCPITTLSSTTSTDLTSGNFNPRQLFFSSDSTRAWVISDLPDLIGLYLPTSLPLRIPYTNGVTAFSGGITLDGNSVYVGASDGTVHLLSVPSNADVQQIAVGLKDANGNLTVPNLVAVQP
jgi:hypothetical protein